MAKSNPNPLNLDLNKLPQPFCFHKLEPEAEPLETPNQNPNPNPSFSEIHSSLQQLLPSGHGGFGVGSSSRSAIVQADADADADADAEADASTSTAVVVSKNSQRRSREMVRVPNISSQDWALSRALVRRTRITYESLRVFLEHYGDTVAPLAAKNRRYDTKSSQLMKDQGLWLNCDKCIVGRIPGIEIGDVFFYRAELCMVGLHSQSLAGIDYVIADQSREPVATSIIVSGGYEDDVDRGHELIYTGQGGQDPKAHKQCGDQKLVRGNLALERSRTYGIEIRVIRRVKCDRSPNGNVYVYDGLYKIMQLWLEIGKSGFRVFKFRLLRIEGQEELGSLVMKIAEDLKAKLLSMPPPRGYLNLDISNGSENIPVSLFNDIDDNRDPFLFRYQARPLYPPWLLATIFGNRGGGCMCNNNCTSACRCAMLNGGKFAYVGNEILLRGKPMVYECGPFCRCPPSCPNRVSQNGVRNRLQVFRSVEGRWGVRSLDLIRAGTFICEMSGFVFNIDGFINPRILPWRWMEWGEISNVLPEYMPIRHPLPRQDFSIDAPMVRNMSCYMSHSDSPNVFIQFVLYDHYNVLFPHLMIFALETIPPLRELTINYGVEQELAL